MDKTGEKSLKTSNYLVGYLIIALLEFIVLVFVGKSLTQKAQFVTEAWYHEIDSGCGNRFAEDYSADSENALLAVPNDNKSFVAVIDRNGNILSSEDFSSNAITHANIFVSINNNMNIRNISKDEAISNLISGNGGFFEYSFSSKNRVLIYTPCDSNNELFVVRVMSKSDFYSVQEEFSAYPVIFFFVVLLFTAALFAITYRVYFRAVRTEDMLNRNSLITEDNDLISFTYHKSIAAFEMTGAVENAFGSEIAARKTVDWNTISQRLHQEDQSMLREISRAVSKGENKISTEFRIVDTEDSTLFHWHRLKGKVIRDSNGDSIRFVGTVQNSDDQISHENMLKNRAEHDLLTGLLNKMTMEDFVNRELEKDSFNAHVFFIIDLDNFKAVNDNLGHATGDLVLTDVSSKLQLIFNENDIIGRLGGDEFAVLLVIPPQMAGQADNLIKHKAKSLNTAMRAQYGNDDIKIDVSCSVGIAKAPEDGSDFKSLYTCADKALYYSKNNGKDRFTFYGDIKR